MKKAVKAVVLGAVSLACCFWAACSSDSSDAVEYVVTFVQDGEVVATKEVVSGGSLSAEDFPRLDGKVGYTVTWDIGERELTNIGRDLTIHAKTVANTYTVTFDLQQGESLENGDGEIVSQSVTYDSAYTLPTPLKAGHTFVCWTYGQTILDGVKWTIDGDVSVRALWTEKKKDYCMLTFVYDADTVVVKSVEKGGSLDRTDVPNVPTEKGYTFAWNYTDFTEIKEDKTIYLTKTANKYKIFLRVPSEGKLPDGQSDEIEVTFGEKVPNIPNAIAIDTNDYSFVGWYDEAGKKCDLSGQTYESDEDIILTARFTYLWIGPF